MASNKPNKANSKGPASKPALVGSYDQKTIQAVVAFHGLCRQSENGTAMDMKARYQDLYDHFHGTTTRLSQVTPRILY